MNVSRLLSMSYFKGIASTLMVVSLLGMSACSKNPVTGRKDFTLINKDQEIAMGRQGHQSILKQRRPYKNPRVQAFVNRLGQQLAKQSHRKDIKYTFTVLDDPTVNAFALPGGYVYITTGIMAYLNSEAELAGVLGHEIGHITAKHGVKQQSAGVAGSILTAILAQKTGASIKEFSNLSRALLSGYGRDHELQADRLGAEYLARIGYNPKSMIDVVGVLKAQEEFDKYQARREGRPVRAYHGVFASHPRNDVRLQKVIAQAGKYKTKVTRAAGHDRYLALTSGLKFRIDKRRTGTINIVRVTSRGETFARLARKSRVGEQRLRLLNGMFPKGEPTLGQYIKIVR